MKQLSNQNIVLDAGTSPVNINLTVPADEYDVIGAKTLVANKSITATLAADVNGIAGSSVPSFIWNGLQLRFNWYARITLDGFTLDVLGRVLTQREAMSDCIITCRYIQVEGGWNVQVELVDEDRTYISVSYTEAAALAGGGNLKPGTTYIISDTGAPNTVGEIELVAVSSTKFDITGKYTFTKQSAGGIYYNGGSVGSSIDSVSVGGVVITTGSEAWDTDLETTIGNVVSNINANSGISGFTAFHATSQDCIILFSVAEGTTENTKVVASVVTAGPGVLVVLGTLQMEQGLDLYDVWVNIKYDFINDVIYSLSDAFGNEFSSQSCPSTNFKQMPWGVSKFRNNKITGAGAAWGLFIGLSGEVLNNVFNAIKVFVFDLGGDMKNNTFLGGDGNRTISSVQQSGNMEGNLLVKSTIHIAKTGGIEHVIGNILENADLKISNGGFKVMYSKISAKNSWNYMELSSSLDEHFISGKNSDYQVSVPIAANSIDLAAFECHGAGIIEITSSDTLDTINNAQSNPDCLIIKPANGKTVTIDGASATNIKLGAIPVVLVGATEDYAVLIRDNSGTGWLLQTYNNY